MKSKLLLLLLFVPVLMKAQIVNIPNPSLKAKLLINNVTQSVARDINNNQMIVDANSNGEIELSEALAVRKLTVVLYDSGDYTGIESFTNLRELVCGGSSLLTQINVSALVNLTTLAVSNSGLTSINIQNLTNLKYLYLQNDELSVIDVSNQPGLIRFYCDGNNLTSLTVSNKPNLIELKCNGNLLTDITLNQVNNLGSIDIRDNLLPQLNLINLPNLYQLLADNNPLTALNLELANLIMLNLYNTQLLEIDLSNCPNATQVLIRQNQLLESVNLKNGNTTSNSHYQIMENPQLKYICVDEAEVDVILEDLALYNITGIQINTYCSFSPGGNYNTISGNITYSTGDCSAGLPLIHNIKVKITDGSSEGALVVNNGSYEHFVGAGTYTVSTSLEVNDWFTITPASATVNFTNDNNNASTQNFCLSPLGVHPDVEVVIVPVGGARPGFDAYYKIIYKNKGNQNLSGNITLNYNEALLDYVALGSTAPTTAASGQLTWAYSNLLPFENREIKVTLNLNGPMEAPPVNNGDILNYTVAITPTTGDETPADNAFAYNQEVVGSYDPNDITCLEGNVVHPDKIGQYLHYNINFENTGTAPATFIVVKDMINTQQFDVNTLQVMSASHNVETRVTGNKVEFVFDDINLGAQGKGNVIFKIKTKPTVAVNSTVMQKADIFFDYNWPIVTNDANTTFTILSRGDFAVDNSVKIYPNPAKDIVTIEGSAELKSIQVYDVQGRLLQLVSASGVQSSINVSSMPKGIYFIKAFTEKGTKLEKIIKE